MSFRLLYDHDPLCGWCFGIIPALRHLQAERSTLPIHLRLGGLVTGERVGPYAAMADYVERAAPRMTAVTGQAPGPAFFDLIRRGDVISASAPPSWVEIEVRERAPDRAVAFAHRLQEMHFLEGRDYADPDTYRAAADGLDLALPDLSRLPQVDDREPRVAADFAAARRDGVTSFPTLTLLDDAGPRRRLPTEYDPERLLAAVDAAILG